MSRDSQAGKYSRTQRNTGNPRGGRRQGEPSFSLNDKAEHNDQEEVIQIPMDKVGRVVGKKGWRRNDIKERSGVQALDIKDCQVRITGTEEQRTKAKTLIYIIIRVCHGKMSFFLLSIHVHSPSSCLHFYLLACL